jgi:hypothetical protein
MLSQVQASPEQLRRWVEDRRAAERREHREQVGIVPSPAQSLVAALRLIALARRRHGWPSPTDPTAVAEDERAWAAWARLRRMPRA